MNSETKHINSAFDQDLDRLLTLLMAMGGQVENAISKSIQALQMSDLELAEQVIADDQRIDALQEEIHTAAVNCIAIRQPQASDLRMVIAVMRISDSLERSGDHAKNTAKRMPIITQHPHRQDKVASLCRFAKTTQTLLKNALDAFIQTDEGKARQVIAQDFDIDQMHGSLFREFVTYMLEDPTIVTPILHLLFVAKNVERIGDHATGIAEQCVYLITGRIPDDERQRHEDYAYLRDSIAG
ncbi:MAG: phosphate signaling complex protein PhoU [Rhodobacteraceae bacterium]|nr:phosphate signaling complex protein PhoU [Paracoccaceae bacterium]MCY4195963.1 phosphate signaling complex protein PhoU [Paracoccaceae bacterium]